MRRIIFRGKSQYEDLWLYGWLMQATDWSIAMIQEFEGKKGEDGDLCAEVIPKTVGQFTGLCDCNGKEVYEGDIIKSMYNDIYHVIGYNESRGAFTATLINEYMDNTDGLKTECNVEQKWLCDMKKVVVGNIHDNPELLKGGGE